jgi:hypothetical protein
LYWRRKQGRAKEKIFNSHYASGASCHGSDEEVNVFLTYSTNSLFVSPCFWSWQMLSPKKKKGEAEVN